MKMKESIKVLVVDDHSLLRGALRDAINSQIGMQVVGEAADGEEAVSLALSLSPDVVLMDIQMPRLNGVEATRRIIEAGLPCRVVMVTGGESSMYATPAREAGALGVLDKIVGISELASAVRIASTGASLF